MYEIFPLLAGVATALGAHRLVAARLRPVALLACSVALGLSASLISGEIFRSLSFLVIDIGFVLLAASVTLFLLTWWERRTERPL